MKSKTFIYDRIIKLYSMPKSHLKEFNNRYTAIKKQLKSSGPDLAGRIDQELNFTHILEQTKAFPFLMKCMSD